MLKRLLLLTITAAFFTAMAAGCGDDKEEPYPGAFDTPYSLGGMFIINVIGTTEEFKRFNYVRCEVTLEVDDSSVFSVFDDRIHRIREIVIESIKAKTIEELQDNMNDLRQEIRDKINKEFNIDAVQRVVISDINYHR
jgi:flagellar basal body-associated protein FliL